MNTRSVFFNLGPRLLLFLATLVMPNLSQANTCVSFYDQLTGLNPVSIAGEFKSQDVRTLKNPITRYFAERQLKKLDAMIARLGTATSQELHSFEKNPVTQIADQIKKLGPIAVDRWETLLTAFFAHPEVSDYNGTSLATGPGWFVMHAHEVNSPVWTHMINRIYERFLIEPSSFKRDQYASFFHHFGAGSLEQIVNHLSTSFSRQQQISPTHLKHLLSAVASFARPQLGHVFKNNSDKRVPFFGWDSGGLIYFYHYFEKGNPEFYAKLSDSQWQTLSAAVAKLKFDALPDEAKPAYLIAKSFLNDFQLSQNEFRSLESIARKTEWPIDHEKNRVGLSYGADVQTMDLLFAFSLQVKPQD